MPILVLSGTGVIDSAVIKQIWMSVYVLWHIVAVITFLGERGLALRGNDENLGSTWNRKY